MNCPPEIAGPIIGVYNKDGPVFQAVKDLPDMCDQAEGLISCRAIA